MTSLRIVVIEDNPMTGWLLAETLTGMGHEVCAVEATEGAAVAAARYRPDLLIVDVHLAEGNGISAMERITPAGPVPHFFISGHDPQAVSGGSETLCKPFREAELAAAIARAAHAGFPRTGTHGAAAGFTALMRLVPDAPGNRAGSRCRAGLTFLGRTGTGQWKLSRTGYGSDSWR